MKSTLKVTSFVRGRVHLLDLSGPVQVFYGAGCYAAGIETRLLSSQRNSNCWKRIKELKQSYPLIHTRDNVRSTHEDSPYTSAGITSGIDLSPAITRENKGPLFANNRLNLILRCQPGQSRKKARSTRCHLNK